MKRFTGCLLIVLVLQVQSIFGWGQKGHDIIAYIAEQNLTCKAKKNISKILDGKSIVYYASWMDNLQNSPDWVGGSDVTKTWHYANVDEGHTYETMPKEPKGDVLTATNMVVAALKTKELDDSTRSVYLKLLVHMVGDMHCPMHAGRLSDRGGNSFKVKWFGQPTNLHAVWDGSLLESSRKWSFEEWQRQLDRHTKQEKRAIAAGTTREWFEGTVNHAATLYKSATPEQNLSYQYIYDYSAILEQQLLYGGYRLAALLNEIFG